MRSLSLFVGTGQCNARCSHCAGIVHRRYAPKEDGVINEDLIYKTITDCYSKGARSLSISSSGEPTLSPLSVTRTLELVYEAEGVEYSPINLYSNGIRIGKDEGFCKHFLPLWKGYGLTTIYVTVHDVDEENNARIYGVKSYPDLNTIISRIHNADLLVRANMVLSKNNISRFERFVFMVEDLKQKGVDMISAWPIRNEDDKVDSTLSPLEEELDKMEAWVERQDLKIRLLREKNRVLYDTEQKLTLFPDGTLSNTWCNN